jgi:hypothetical protein
MRIINIFPNCSYLDLSSFVSSYRQLLTRVDDLKEENSKLSYEVLYSPHPLLLLLLLTFSSSFVSVVRRQICCVDALLD